VRYTTIGSGTPSARKVSMLSLGAMWFGTTTDEATSFAILDRYAAAGGNFIDTRLEALEQVAKETGATANQVVLAWLIGGELPVVPLIGASSVAQLDESLAAVDLQLTQEQRQLPDAAN
jgi:aryl-alcohol dehydrogenase-like predicted oxidoreductase